MYFNQANSICLYDSCLIDYVYIQPPGTVMQWSPLFLSLSSTFLLGVQIQTLYIVFRSLA